MQLEADWTTEHISFRLTAAFSILSSRDGQEVAVVYFRDGYMPGHYSLQVGAFH